MRRLSPVVSASPPRSQPRLLSFRRCWLRGLGRPLIRLLARLRITGAENFPKAGPLIVVGNHTALLDPVLMAIFSPWPVDIIGGTDIPRERFSEIISSGYGFIPVKRGQVDRAALRLALDVLKRGGVIGIFPQGGIWQTTASDLEEQSLQRGVAWLSQQSGAPVLPMYFGGTYGALLQALRLKRPRLSIHVGKQMPAAAAPAPGEDAKTHLQAYTRAVMRAVGELQPEEERRRLRRMANSQFFLEVRAGEALDPAAPPIHHASALAQMLLNPTILRVYSKNLCLPTQALENLAARPPARQLAEACRRVLQYLEQENPTFLTYRFGFQQGKAMQQGLAELEALCEWADARAVGLQLTPILTFTDLERGMEVRQVGQGQKTEWM